MLKQLVQNWLKEALERLRHEQKPESPGSDFQVERSRNRAHGDYASNAALVLAGTFQTSPRALAQQLIERLPDSELRRQVEIAGPGFLNFFLHESAYHAIVQEVLDREQRYGHSQVGAGCRVLLEFVSANPTGPLHVGHGRVAAYGDVLGNLLQANGYQVHREYYVNDVGRQAELLGLSLWLRALEAAGESVPPFPCGAYQGKYIQQLVARLPPACAETTLKLPDASDWPPAGEDEAHLDALIALAKTTLGQQNFQRLADFGMEAILEQIRDELQHFGITMDTWLRESSLQQRGAIQQGLDLLRKQNHLYQEGGAVWFRSSAFGDAKDRVVVRENGRTTYFAADVAYHLHKYRQGYHHIINVWGADHHGYEARLRAAVRACGQDPQSLEIRLVQLVSLHRGGTKIQMSTRAGEYVTLHELRQEISRDAARFFYLTRKIEQRLEFDMELAKAQSRDNPIYYIQYAHARICSILKHAEIAAPDAAQFNHLREPEEKELMRLIAHYPELIREAAQQRDPQQLSSCLRELANGFHVYYGRHRVLVDDPKLRSARISLLCAVRQVLKNGLALFGIQALEQM